MKENIRRLRLAKGLTQGELGAMLGYSGSAIAMWESGDRKPPSDRIPDLARALGCRIEELYGEEVMRSCVSG